jgi:hypothetical protein
MPRAAQHLSRPALPAAKTKRAKRVPPPLPGKIDDRRQIEMFRDLPSLAEPSPLDADAQPQRHAWTRTIG